MPFTISHAAAVLPVHQWTRERLPLAALMIGSMSPDFSYFFMGTVRSATHSLHGLITFCWPVGLVTWLLFVCVLERPTLALMPPNWSARIVPPHREWTLRTFVIASIAVLLGAVTHILWDAFTHANTHMTEAIPALQAVALQLGGMNIRWYWILQQLSTIFGLVVLFVWATRRLKAPPAQPHDALPAVSNSLRVAALVVLIVASLGYAVFRYSAFPGHSVEFRLFHLAIGGMTGFALAWLAIAVTFHVRTYRRARAS